MLRRSVENYCAAHPPIVLTRYVLRGWSPIGQALCNHINSLFSYLWPKKCDILYMSGFVLIYLQLCTKKVIISECMYLYSMFLKASVMHIPAIFDSYYILNLMSLECIYALIICMHWVLMHINMMDVSHLYTSTLTRVNFNNSVAAWKLYYNYVNA